MLTEAKIEKQVVAYCHKRGLYTRKFASPAHRGVPDRIICGRGKVLFLELKRPGNNPTALQLREMAELQRHGMAALWVSSLVEAQIAIQQHFDTEKSQYPTKVADIIG